MNYIRVLVTAEGPTEQKFAVKVLAEHLIQFGVIVNSRSVLTSRDKRASREYRGGLKSYQQAKKDIETWIKEDNNRDCRYTTMFDYYALPKDFPGYEQAIKMTNPYDKVQVVEEALSNDIGDHRFVPYIQLHEFEALVFADPEKLNSEYLEHNREICRLIELSKRE